MRLTVSTRKQGVVVVVQLREDIEAAKNKTQSRVGSGREIKKLETYLWEGERVALLASGQYGPGYGLVVLTDRRLMFIKDGLMSQTVEDFPLEKVSSVQWSAGIALGSLVVFTSGNKAEIKGMNKKDGQQIADAIRARLSAPHVPVAPTVHASGADDVYESLRKLGQLRDAGVVTPAEFDAKKRELMLRI